MANPEHIAKLLEGPEAWNQWRKEHPDLRPDLRKADLRKADLDVANLDEADLSGATLSEARLLGANLGWATLVMTNLGGANLVGANLHGADLHEAELLRTIFGGTDLSEAKELDTCIHRGPSILDHWTLAKSGPLPLAFLRGCGLSDWQIEAAKLHLKNLSNQEVTDIVYSIATLRLGQAIQFDSCFISYSTKDQVFAERLHRDLQDNGVRCWFAPRQIQGGKKIHEQIDKAIRLYDRLLLILSKGSMESEWVATEIAKARKREVREKRRVLFPVRIVDFETLRDWECFDADTGKDSAREIREFFIPDFGNWKDHDSYQKAFDRLLKDLKATDSETKDIAAPQGQL